MLAELHPIVKGAVTVLKDLSSDEDLRFRAEREMFARLDEIDWEQTVREEAYQEACLDVYVEARDDERKQMARMMRSDGEPEEKVIRYTSYSFSDLDTKK